jgi:hypothetical protein
MGPKGSATHDTWGSFTQAFEAMQQIVTSRARIGYLWPLFEMSGDKAAPHAAIIRQWLDPIVRETVASKARAREIGSTSPVEEVSFLQRLAESTEGVHRRSYRGSGGLRRLLNRYHIDTRSIAEHAFGIKRHGAFRDYPLHPRS